MSESLTALNEQQVLEASDEAITLAQHLVAEDYAKDNPLDVRVEENRGFKKIFTGIIDLITGRGK